MEVTSNDLINLIGEYKTNIFKILCLEIESLYDVEHLWNIGKKWNYEYKFRKNNKTLCSFYFKDATLKLIIVLGKEERNKLKLIKSRLYKKIIGIYNKAPIMRDGKRIMLEIKDLTMIDDIKELLFIKRQPDRVIKK